MMKSNVSLCSLLINILEKLTINWDISNRDGNVTYMTPDMYFEYTDGLDVSRRSTSSSAIENYMVRMKRGDKIKAPELWFEDNVITKQEGRHRLMAAEKLGVTSIPVITYEYIGN